MSWKPNIEDCPQPPAFHKYLKRAVDRLVRKGLVTFPKRRLFDRHGLYGFVFPQFVLVAKERTYGNLVSAHLSAVLQARADRVGLVMWLESAKRFYWFDPQEILDSKPEMNQKGYAEMCNYGIRLGKPLEEW